MDDTSVIIIYFVREFSICHQSNFLRKNRLLSHLWQLNWCNNMQQFDIGRRSFDVSSAFSSPSITATSLYIKESGRSSYSFWIYWCDPTRTQEIDGTRFNCFHSEIAMHLKLNIINFDGQRNRFIFARWSRSVYFFWGGDDRLLDIKHWEASSSFLDIKKKKVVVKNRYKEPKSLYLQGAEMSCGRWVLPLMRQQEPIGDL